MEKSPTKGPNTALSSYRSVSSYPPDQDCCATRWVMYRTSWHRVDFELALSCIESLKACEEASSSYSKEQHTETIDLNANLDSLLNICKSKGQYSSYRRQHTADIQGLLIQGSFLYTFFLLFQGKLRRG
ncbi:MAG TPA: hypothetical protein VN040_08060 [Pseudosphingobacterium sp.]|nr:hypothetical protein [Pseudosphingobacterium sp.]